MKKEEKEKAQVLVVKHLYKVFGKKIVLKNITFSVNKGDILGIIGMSGSGKTVLLKTIMNFFQPNSGQILYKGKPITKPTAKKVFGFSVQESSFYPELTVKENLFHFGRLYRMTDNEIKKRAHELLKMLELHSAENKLASQLSGGMQKRLDIACAMIHKPEMLLLDEPTEELDLLRKNEVLKLINSINKKGVTVLIASLPLEVEQICNKIIFIDKGAMVSTNDIKSKMKTLYQNHFKEILKKFKPKNKKC